MRSECQHGYPAQGKRAMSYVNSSVLFSSLLNALIFICTPIFFFYCTLPLFILLAFFLFFFCLLFMSLPPTVISFNPFVHSDQQIFLFMQMSLPAALFCSVSLFQHIADGGGFSRVNAGDMFAKVCYI